MKKASDIRRENIGRLFECLGGLVGPSWPPSKGKMGSVGRVKKASWNFLGTSWGRLARMWHLGNISGVLLGSPRAPKKDFGSLKSCPGTAQGRFKTPNRHFTKVSRMFCFRALTQRIPEKLPKGPRRKREDNYIQTLLLYICIEAFFTLCVFFCGILWKTSSYVTPYYENRPGGMRGAFK